MTSYEYIERLFKNTFLAGVWFGQEIRSSTDHRLQADLTATSKMQKLIDYLHDLGIEIKDGQIVIREQED